jgi:outer membrane receptor protein involved in Fe transport
MKGNMNGRGGVVVFGLAANLVRGKTPIRIAIEALRLLMLTSFLAATALAQTETGQITGTVFDQTGGFIPNATVTATDLATSTARTVMTTNGIYAFPNLLPGRYEVQASAPNFQTTKEVVTVTVGSKIGLNFHLTVGTITQIVEVEEQPMQINTETQTLSTTISGDEVLNLPTISRDPYDLVKTVGNTTDSDGGSRTRGVKVSMNGLRSSDVGILLDGVPNKNNFDTLVAIDIPLDSVGEVNVLTNTFTAEYGRALAGFVNVDTKRGTNAIHGTVYEFNRASAFASNTTDNKAKGVDKPHFTRNQFGFSAGGPIVKDKLFVFANPEWIRVRSEASQQATIVTPELLAASAPATQTFFSTYGKLKPGIIPLQTFRYDQACTSTTIGDCTAIPASTPSYRLVSYNVPADSGGGDPENTLLLVGRLDYVLSDKSQFYFRYARYDSNFFNGVVTNSPYVGYDTGESDLKNSYALSATHMFSPTLVSQTKLSYNRVFIFQGLSTAPIGPTLYTTLGATNSLGGGQIIYPGYSPFSPGNAVPFGGPQNYIQINEDLTKVKGKHNLRFGGLFTYLQDNRTFGAYEEAVEALGTNTSNAVDGFINGQLHDFQAAVYPQGKFPCINGPSGRIVTPACTLNLPVNPPNFSRSNADHEAALYVQDSWKVRPRLTLNLGLRWEYFGPQASRNPNLDSNFYFGAGSNIELQSGTGQVLVSTDKANPVGGLWKKDWHDFGPRVGFAWDVFGNGKTSLRGGYGLGWNPNFGNVTFNVIQNPPNYAVIALTAGSDVPTIPITTDNSGPLAGSGGTKPIPRVTLRAVDPNIKTEYAHLWSAALEHQFGTDLIAAVEYTGSKGVNLYSINRLNIPGSTVVYGGIGSGSGSSTDRINNQYSYINFRTNGGFSNYNALNVRAEMRNFRRQGVTLRFNYTWAHAIDNISNTFSETTTGAGNLGVLDPLNPGLDKGDAEYDVRNRVTLAAIWEVGYKGKNRATDAILGGWSIIPNFSARTGIPFTVWDCTHSKFVFCPRAMYATPFHPVYTQTPTGNPNEFNYMPLGTPDSTYKNPNVDVTAKSPGASDFGPFPSTMTGRDAFRAPGVWTMDFAIHKNFNVSERFKLQLRGEAFNVFNHSNLYLVYSNTDLSSTSFITATRGVRNDNGAKLPTTENRNLQLALKLLF